MKLTGLWDRFRQRDVVSGLESRMQSLETSLDGAVALARENLDDLSRSIDNDAWTELSSAGGGWDLTLDSLRKLIGLSRKMYLKNPLFRRAVEVQALYVWAKGTRYKAKHPLVQQVIDDFYSSVHNRKVVGPAYIEREREQRIQGNTFFCLWFNEINGACRVRIIPVDEVMQVVCNPEDGQEPRLYLRSYSTERGSSRVAYPDVNYKPDARPAQYAGYDIIWNAPVLHVRTGGLPSMRFGIPELWSIIDWAKHYRIMLENWASIVQSYARLAFKVSGMGGKDKLAAAKSKMGTGISGNTFGDSNPPPNTASWMFTSGGVDISAVRTAGATTSAEEGRPLKLMVAAGSDIPDTFFGDADVGNYATSQTLDRPTELKFVNRQGMWAQVIERIHAELIHWSASTRGGYLRGAGASVVSTPSPFDASPEYRVKMPRNTDDRYGPVGEPISTQVVTIFPEILERNVVERVRAVVQAATLNGSKAEGIIPDRKIVARELLRALQIEDWEQILEQMYPNGPELQGYVDPEEELRVKTPPPVNGGANGAQTAG